MLVEMLLLGSSSQIADDLRALRDNGVPFIDYHSDKDRNVYIGSRAMLERLENKLKGAIGIFNWRIVLRDRDVALAKITVRHFRLIL